MKDKRERMLEYMTTLYVSKELSPRYSECCDFIRKHNLRDVELIDETQSGLDIIVIHIAGRGRWASFKDFSILKCDFNKVTNMFADAYVYREGGRGLPQRVSRYSCTFAVIND